MQHIKQPLAFALAACGALLLTACGGGGDEDDSPDGPDEIEETGPAMIEGAWTGTALHMNTSSPRPAVLVATRDGDTLLYIQRGVDSAVVRGDACCDHLVEGNGFGWTLVNQARTNAPVRLLITDLINGQRAITGQVTVEGQLYEIDMRRHADYQQALSLATLSGSYTLTTSAGPRVTFDVSPTGALTGTDVVGCQFSAQVNIPDTTRNLFVLPSLTMSGCTGGATVRNGTYSGVGYLAGLADPQAPKVLTFILTGNLVYAMALPGAALDAQLVSLQASHTEVEYGATATLQWEARAGSTCTANGGWSGTKVAGRASEVTAPLTASTTFSLTCSLAGQTQTASAQIGVPPLPADPGQAGMEGIAGIDANANGVRDDVERVVLTTYPPGDLRDSLIRRATIVAGALQTTTSETAREAFTQMLRNTECLYSIDRDRAKALAAELVADVVNTQARANAYIEFAQRTGGLVVTLRDPEEFSASCAE